MQPKLELQHAQGALDRIEVALAELASARDWPALPDFVAEVSAALSTYKAATHTAEQG
jgi:hypothetical protein